MKKSRPKRISVLFIPDDNAEPHSFRLSLRVVRLLMVCGIILILHVLAGGYSYWKWYDIQKENTTLAEKNESLRDDNKRIYALQQQFETINKANQKVLNLLGVDGVKGPSLVADNARYGNGRISSARDMAKDLAGDVQPDVERLESKSRIISRKVTTLHDYTHKLPTLLPVEGYLSTDFSINSWLLGIGNPGAEDWHPGIDIAARRGTDILAAGAGTVVFTGWTSKYGNMVIINHGDNIFTYYAHNSKLLVNDKAYVRKGEPIAQLGNSGYTSKGPHLHFEIWKDGKPVNPREYILAFHSDGS